MRFLITTNTAVDCVSCSSMRASSLVALAGVILHRVGAGTCGIDPSVPSRYVCRLCGEAGCAEGCRQAHMHPCARTYIRSARARAHAQHTWGCKRTARAHGRCRTKPGLACTRTARDARVCAHTCVHTHAQACRVTPEKCRCHAIPCHPMPRHGMPCQVKHSCKRARTCTLPLHRHPTCPRRWSWHGASEQSTEKQSIATLWEIEVFSNPNKSMPNYLFEVRAFERYAVCLIWTMSPSLTFNSQRSWVALYRCHQFWRFCRIRIDYIHAHQSRSFFLIWIECFDAMHRRPLL